MSNQHLKPSSAFIGASWAALLIGMGGFIAGLWNANMQLVEKGFYFVVLMYGLYSAISVQKTVRDRLEGVKVTGLYYMISWFSVILAIVSLAVGLWNATMAQSEKGFYLIAYFFALFGAIAVQKNTRDLSAIESSDSASSAH